jgi:hypothetical protein
VALAEQLAAVEPVELDQPADHGDDDHRAGDPGEAAHRVHQILLPGAGEDDPGEEHDRPDPDRHRHGVGDAGDHPDDLPLASRAGETEGDDRQGGDPDRGELRRRVDHPLGSQDHPSRRDHEHQAGDRRPPRPTGVEQVEPAGRVEAVAERLVVDRGGEGDDVEQGAEEADQPNGSQEADGDHVLRSLRPRGDDEHEGAEEHGDPERREHAAEPDRPAGHVRGVQHLVVAARAGVDGASGLRRGGPGAGRTPGGRRRGRLHREAEAAVDARLTGRLADLPADLAVRGRHRLDDLDDQRAPVVAHLRRAVVGERIAVARDVEQVGVADRLGEREPDLARGRGEDLTVGGVGLLERVLGVDRLAAADGEDEEQRAEHRRHRGDEKPQRVVGNTGSARHHRTTVVGRVAGRRHSVGR